MMWLKHCVCLLWCRRFDIMWLLLDETDEQNDMRLAAHIINVHQGRVGTAAAAASNAAGSSSSSTVSVASHMILSVLGYPRTAAELPAFLLCTTSWCSPCPLLRVCVCQQPNMPLTAAWYLPCLSCISSAVLQVPEGGLISPS
jgi:hypothetical protein